MVIPSDRVSNLSSVSVSVLSSPPLLPHCFHPLPISKLAFLSSPNLAAASDTLTLAAAGTAQSELNLLRDPWKGNAVSQETFDGRQHEMGEDVRDGIAPL